MRLNGGKRIMPCGRFLPGKFTDRPKIASLRLETSPLRPEISPHLVVISLHWTEFSLVCWNQTSETWSNLFRPPHLFPGRMETHPCVLQDIGPLRPLPCSHLTSSPKYSKQGNGYRWPCAILGWLVTFSAFLSFLSIPLPPRSPSDLPQHCSCPPAHDWGSRVSGLVIS